MGIGSYRHHVALLSPIGEPDPPDWYCSITPAGAQVVDGQATFLVRGPYHVGITLETQIVFEGRTLQVQSVSDPDETHRELVLLAVEVRGRV